MALTVLYSRDVLRTLETFSALVCLMALQFCAFVCLVTADYATRRCSKYSMMSGEMARSTAH